MQMVPVRAYHAPATLDEYFEVMGGESGRIVTLAGGQSVLPLLKARQLRPEVLIDLAKIAELRREPSIDSDGTLEIGAMVRYRDIARTAAVSKSWAALADASTHIGDVQVQNRGTLGGNLVFGSVQTDMRQVVMCLDGELCITGPEGSRTVSALELFANARLAMLRSGELLRAVRFPAPTGRSGSAYVKYGIIANGRPVIGIAAAISLDGSGACSHARFVVGGLLPNPMHAERAEQTLVGGTVDDDLIAVAADAAADDAKPQDDFRGSPEYRKQLIRVYGRQALRQALQRAQEDIG